MSDPFLLGVLGGMGPLATLDFQRHLLEATPAAGDQQHLPSVVWNVPQIPDRQQALAGTGPSPLAHLLRAVEKLNQAGASHIAIPCNTAHHWYDALSAASTAPVLHIVDATMAALAREEDVPRRVGIIATRGTLEAGWYQQRLAARGIESVEPTPRELADWFVPGCYAVKRGAVGEGGELLARQARALLARGAQQLVLACTEVPVALAAIKVPFLARTFDPARALAQQCARLWRASQDLPPVNTGHNTTVN